MTDPQEEPMTDLAVKPGDQSQVEIRVELTVNAELLLEAQRQISAESLDAAVNEALRRLVDEEREKRAAAGARLKQMYDDGDLDFDPDDEAAL
ncbi:hypothetical protein ACQPZJ_39410 [Actinoplanes sp. CA-054009]